jgi:hypothetical protein
MSSKVFDTQTRDPRGEKWPALSSRFSRIAPPRIVPSLLRNPPPGWLTSGDRRRPAQRTQAGDGAHAEVFHGAVFARVSSQPTVAGSNRGIQGAFT